MELAADNFSGMLLGLLGASENDIISLCENFVEESCEFYSKRNVRKTAMLNGFFSVKNLNDENATAA